MDTIDQAVERVRLTREAEALRPLQRRALRNAVEREGGGWRVPFSDPGYRGLTGLGLALSGKIPGTLGKLTRKGELVRALLLLQQQQGTVS